MIWGVIIGIPIGAALFAVVKYGRTFREVYRWMRFGG